MKKIVIYGTGKNAAEYVKNNKEYEIVGAIDQMKKSGEKSYGFLMDVFWFGFFKKRFFPFRHSL